MKTITQTVPTTIIRPETIQVVKSIASVPNTSSSHLQGRSRNTTTARPHAVNARRSGTPTRRRSGTRLMRDRDTPNSSGVAVSPERPRYTSPRPIARPHGRAHDPAATPYDGGLRQVPDRRSDRHRADAPGRHRDHDEREDEADGEGDDETPRRHGELDLKTLVGVRRPECVRHEEDHPERDHGAEERADERRGEVVGDALEREHLGEMAPAGADRPGDAQLATTLGCEHHEDEEDEQDAGGDREGAERREERDEGGAGGVGVLDRVLLERS